MLARTVRIAALATFALWGMGCAYYEYRGPYPPPPVVCEPLPPPVVVWEPVPPPPPVVFYPPPPPVVVYPAPYPGPPRHPHRWH